jgi:hypothetical protein
MLVLPVGGAHLDRSARLEPLKSERFQFFGPLPVSLNESLQVRLDAESLNSARARILVSSSGCIEMLIVARCSLLSC